MKSGRRYIIIGIAALVMGLAVMPVAMGQSVGSRAGLGDAAGSGDDVRGAVAVSDDVRVRRIMSLQECCDLAVGNNVDVRNAALDSAAAVLRTREALAEYFPSVSATAMAFHALDPLLRISVSDVLGRSDMALQIQDQVQQWGAAYGLNTTYNALQYGYTGGLSLTQPVFAGGRIVNGNRLAGVGVKAASAKSSMQKRTTREQVSRDYYQIVSLQQKMETLQAVQTMLDTVLNDVSSAVAAGVAVETDLTNVKIKKAELSSANRKLTSGLRLAKMNLLNSIDVQYNPYPGVESEYPSLDEFEFEGSLENLPVPEAVYVDEQQAVASLDEQKLLDMQVQAKQLEKKMVLGEALPSVAMGATYGYAKTFNDPRWNGAVYAMVRIPITDWGKNSRKLERMELEVRKAQNTREYLGAQLVLQMRKLYVELECAYDQMQIQYETMLLSSERFRQMYGNYSAGVSTLSELLQSETAMRSAQQDYIDACLEYLVALQAYGLRTGK